MEICLGCQITAVHEEGPFHIHQQEKFIKEIKSSQRKTQALLNLDFSKHFKKTKPVNIFLKPQGWDTR